jgi:nucleotide-binding universal stress UspA family protein
MRKIICPVDFSKSSLNAAEYACALAADFRSEVTLLHVYEAPTLFSDVPLDAIRNQEEEMKAVAKEKLKTLTEKLSRKHKSLKFKTALLEGDSAGAIRDYAKRVEAELIVVGKTGNSKLKRLLLGSTTAEIIREVDGPVLIIPPGKTFSGINKIVFATDLHEDNIGASLAITSFARHFHAEIVFVYVDDKNLIHSDEKIDEMTRKIKRKIKYPKLSGYIAKNTSVSKGIEYFLEKNKADLLVLFSHPRRFPGMVFNQSITKIVSHRAEIPMLALKVSGGAVLEELR